MSSTSGLKAYVAVTAAYWGFTLTDGALRMLVLLHFNTLGYSPLQLAMLFVLYEFCGVITNLFGGWIGARLGLKVTLWSGLLIQIGALIMLSLLNPAWTLLASVAWVITAQGLSGIAKDLTKMSAKSAIKTVVPEGRDGALFRWVAILTGSKNALKGAGFFLGTLLLEILGFNGGLWAMAAGLAVVLTGSMLLVPPDIGKVKGKVGFTAIFAKSREINLLSAARFFLFGARDVWFVVGLPLFLYDVAGWTFTEVGAFLALWTIGYGIVQASAPTFVKRSPDGRTAETRAARLWVLVLAFIPAAMAVLLLEPGTGIPAQAVVLVGLGLFGVVFALNSAIHSYLILAYTEGDKVALNVGFYYMANAGGRLIGTLLSGWVYQLGGIEACLVAAGVMVASSWLISLLLPVTVPPGTVAPVRALADDG
ncbi:organoarsenical effux MFS transporter ArsJ [Inquilinus sp. OTU3971]|uniref:organoarsenical effux MFS transporter ArsJ n=1 Tax=Inquilinus sp. OTU3971 TaxID=3043855 RepID=UPI00313CBD5E